MNSPFKLIGKTDPCVRTQIEKAYHQLFSGDKEKERICFNYQTLKYIVDIGHSLALIFYYLLNFALILQYF